MALYSRLLKYAPQASRTQLENFMTESLCDWLDRVTALDRNSAETFVVQCLAGSRVPLAFKERLTTARNLSWKTQHSFYFDDSRGYLDLCLFADKEIILVIENKIAAGFTTHAMSPDDEEAENTDSREGQLNYYSRWLAKKYAGAALILLTHLTDAPPDFLSKENDKVEAEPTPVFHRICRWARVYEWLAEWRELAAKHSDSKPEGTFLHLLTNEFLELLEQENMNATPIENDDLELLNAYFSQDVGKKVRDLMVSVRTLVLPLLVDAYGKPRGVFPQAEAWGETQILWDWAYCHEKNLQWYVGWGLSGRHGLRHFEIEFPAPLQAFVMVTNDDGGARIPVATEDIQICESDGWLVHESRTIDQLILVKSVSMQDLGGESESFNQVFERWTVGAVKAGINVMNKAHAHLR
jgi:hypothetical protein